MSRRLIAVLVLLVVVLGGGALLLAGGGVTGSDGSPSPTLPPVPPATTVSADARVVPVRTAELVAPAGAGVVVEVFVAAGDAVTAGEALVRFDDARATAAVAEADAAVRAGEAAVARADALAAQANAQVTAAGAAVDEAEAAVTAADAVRDGLPGSATSAQKRAANADVTRASAGLRAARAQLDAARQARTAAEQGAVAAAADLDRARAAADAARAALAELTLRAPVAGTIASAAAVVGEVAPPGSPVVRIADLTSWRFLTTDLDETAVARVRVGATAIATVDALPDTPIDVRVTAVAPFGELVAGDVRYEVSLEPIGAVPDGLRWNMTASVTIETGEAGGT